MRISKNNIDEYTNDKENLIGKKIRIISMDDPYDGKRYNGKEGIIELVMTDPYGEICYAGTWGGLNVYPNIDEIEFIEENLPVQEGLFDISEDNVDYGHKAWLLNEIISSMNDETAYYDTEWLYIWPDGESYEECIEDFGDKQSFKELENTFLSIYQYNDAEEGEDPEDAEYNFHRDGLYNPTQEAVDLAHQYDRKLGLSPIKVLGTIKK